MDETTRAIQSEIIRDIHIERIRQVTECKHGGDTDKFDMGNSRNDWVAYITAYLGRAAQNVSRNEKDSQFFNANLIKVGALVMAALEARAKGYC